MFAEDVLRNLGEHEVGRARAGRSDARHWVARLPQVGDPFGVEARIDPEHIGVVCVGRHAAEPAHLQRIESRIGIALNGKLRRPALEDRNRHAVLLGVCVEAVGEHEPGALHVLDHDRRLARNMAAEMARHKPRHQIVAAARHARHQEIDCTAFVELLDRFRLRGGDRGECGREPEQERASQKSCPRHGRCPVGAS